MVLGLLILACLWGPLSALCPSQCSCYLDPRGRNAVLCKDGGIVGPLDLFNMSADTEVLKITAPEDNMNQLTMSPIFSNYKNLEEIHITRSNIPQLGMHFFLKLKKLDVLDLSQNNITQPLDHNFRGLMRLKELYLDDNRISSLPSGTFRFLEELKVLSIQRNRIAELTPRIFLEIGKLKVLKLSGNHLQELNPVVFEDVRELKSLECRSCGLAQIDKQVYELLPHLTHLDLGDNLLTSITPEEFSPLTNLRHLKLDGNRITAIKSSVFPNQHELKRLTLARNRITKISRNAFANLHNLTELDLSHNKFENPENGLLEPVAATLEVLSLNGNHLSVPTLKSLLNDLRIKELHLADCGLFELGKLVPDTVQVLSLGNNYISSLAPEALPESLAELDITGNKFVGLDNDLLARLDHLKRLELDGNPWACDLCHIVPLLERANRSSAVRNLQCAQPYSLKGMKLGALHFHELTWCTVPSTASDANFFLLGDDGRLGLIAAGTSVALLFFTVVGVLGVLLYSRRHAAKYYTHEDKLAMDGDSIFENHSPLFGDERELSFKFPLDGERKVSVATIDEIKKEHAISNGT
ncbi:leucine-rich repeat-containing protein 15 [Tribolium castaneum]|uniref:Protein toll-like Protein n=1 Tax=Tribolium castaneum TaxID=7070 RepID=D6WMY6_TRICA|nr:PREDICTED: leucine-rich repeat-containing protein 15 [Tribolium castaneum]XP_015836061.1 PREDICTED: leucine-rich repeat-containing protein 15 [Tribolium castaneum]EFA04323.2 Protein toll-like Protein [Tribolium castaneum]|eukprot:XP_008194245.1 PREDICTED: leucine-rich repeat-containing protein 15 [Tribolium castaneum]